MERGRKQEKKEKMVASIFSFTYNILNMRLLSQSC